jgi:hypothetical protein
MIGGYGRKQTTVWLVPQKVWQQSFLLPFSFLKSYRYPFLLPFYATLRRRIRFIIGSAITVPATTQPRNNNAIMFTYSFKKKARKGLAT